ncbi:MAG: hypothetical protein RJR35_04620 [Thermoanaerobacterales bacterium]|nr:hypothetical protein [Thermoanaerobacterales bacterium]
MFTWNFINFFKKLAQWLSSVTNLFYPFQSDQRSVTTGTLKPQKFNTANPESDLSIQLLKLPKQSPVAVVSKTILKHHQHSISSF